MFSYCHLCIRRHLWMKQMLKKDQEVVLYYNSTKGGVDTADEMLCTCSTKAASRRWPLAHFFNLLDIVSLDSFVIAKNFDMTRSSKKKFLIELVANSSPQTVFYSYFYLLLQSFPQMQFLTLYFARCRLGLQRPPARCIVFVYCHDNRHVIILHFFIFCLCTAFLLFPPS